ncbi:hypothetical protein J14TS2_26210 [Bacillus sp. J14TS2]|uniref:hypothetical protein n=1 Tax=Bacillus sp. J14TS2 TaxID=2807188 RepID=UPI001B29FF4F|nr:hypothetical protein [Bacillus sp. J14TS2]GIN72146.1 hypothetical protein J14TS2_26210 [Bacillus sp. J14TS2]
MAVNSECLLETDTVAMGEINMEHINLTGRQRMNFFERLTKSSVWPAYVGCIYIE